MTPKKSVTLDLDGIYRVPEPADTLEDFERHAHRDLAGMSRPVLLRERARLRLRLTLDDAPDGWLLDRLRRIDEMLHGTR